MGMPYGQPSDTLRVVLLEMQWLGVSIMVIWTSVPPKPSGTLIQRIWRPSDWSFGDPPWGPLLGPFGTL